MNLEAILQLAVRTGLRRLGSTSVRRIVVGVAVGTIVFWWGVGISQSLAAQIGFHEQRLAELGPLTSVRTLAGDDTGLLITRWQENSGEPRLLVSPALDDVEPSTAVWTDDLPWPVAGVVPDELLAYPDERMALLTVDPAVVPVQRTEDSEVDRGPPPILPLVSLMIISAPAAALLWVSCRSAAEGRAGVYRALSIAGVARRDTRRVAVVEGLLFGAVGSVVAVVLFILTLALTRAITPLGGRFHLADQLPGPIWAAMLLVIPVAVSGAATGLAGVDASECSTTDPVKPPPSSRRLIPLAAGLLLLPVAGVAARLDSVAVLVLVEIVALLLIMVGVVLGGPVFVRGASSLRLDSGTMTAGPHLAMQMIGRNPRRAYRSVAGLSIVALVYGFVLPLVQPVRSELLEIEHARVVYSLALSPEIAEKLVMVAEPYGPDRVVPMARLFTPTEFVIRAPCVVASQFGSAESCNPASEFELDTEQARLMVPSSQRIRFFATSAADLFASRVPELDVVVDTEGLTAADRGQLMSALRRVVPAAAFSSLDDLYIDNADERTTTQAVSSIFVVSTVLTAAAVLVTTIGNLAERRQLEALLHLIGFTRRDRRRLALGLFAVPVVVSVLPALAVGIVASLSLAASLDGDYAFPVAGLGLAILLVAVLVVVAAGMVAASVRPRGAAESLLAARGD